MKRTGYIWTFLPAVLVVVVMMLTSVGCKGHWGGHKSEHPSSVEHPSKTDHPKKKDHPSKSDHPKKGSSSKSEHPKGEHPK